MDINKITELTARLDDTLHEFMNPDDEDRRRSRMLIGGGIGAGAAAGAYAGRKQIAQGASFTKDKAVGVAYRSARATEKKAKTLARLKRSKKLQSSVLNKVGKYAGKARRGLVGSYFEDGGDTRFHEFMNHDDEDRRRSRVLIGGGIGAGAAAGAYAGRKQIAQGASFAKDKAVGVAYRSARATEKKAKTLARLKKAKKLKVSGILNKAGKYAGKARRGLVGSYFEDGVSPANEILLSSIEDNLQRLSR